MTNFEKTQNGQKNPADIIAKIKTARDEARIKANAYRHLTGKRYDFCRAKAATKAYTYALELIDEGEYDLVRALADDALAVYEAAQNVDVTERALASFDGEHDALLTVVDLMDGHRDALVSVVDWMNNKEGGDS